MRRANFGSRQDGDPDMLKQTQRSAEADLAPSRRSGWGYKDTIHDRPLPLNNVEPFSGRKSWTWAEKQIPASAGHEDLDDGE